MSDTARMPTEGSEEPSSPRYYPGFDGIRGVGMIFVLVYHGGYTFAHGSFLGVSMFLTLSGFLITLLLAGEVNRTERFDFKRFLVRRVRRLAPASYVCILLVAACAPWFAASGQPVKLRGDIVATLGYGANWRFVASQQSYADLFVGGTSPLLHFWSLALEEQIYLVFALLMVGAVALGRRLHTSWVPTIMLVVLIVASVVSTFFTHDLDLGYYGTHVRAAEVLIGCLAAMLLNRYGLHRIFARPRPWAMAGLVAMVMFIASLFVFERNEAFVLGGWLPVAAVVWCVMIVGLMVPGPALTFVKFPPFVFLGRTCFSLYLYHWPVNLVLTEQRLQVPGLVLFAIRLAVTFALALASYHLVEHPIRTGRFGLRRWRGALAYSAIVAVSVGAAYVHLRPGPVTVFDEMLNAPEEVVVFGNAAGGASAVEPSGNPMVVVLLGTDVEVAEEVRAAAAAAGATVVDLTDLGCTVLDNTRECTPPAQRLAAHIESGGRADVVALAVGATEREIVGRRLGAFVDDGLGAVAAELGVVSAEMVFVHDVYAALPSTARLDVIDLSPPPPAGERDVVGPLFLSEAFSLPGVGHYVAAEVTARMYERTSNIEASRRRVMVVGDSASYGVAIELDRLAGDQLEVVWAGRHNCPIVPAVEIRWWEGAEFDTSDCVELQQRWPSLIRQFRPDVLLVVVSLTEHSDQRYSEGDEWHPLGDDRYTAVHEERITTLVRLLGEYGGQMVIADSAHGPTSPRNRVDAWNALLAQWDERFDDVSLAPFGAAVEAAEAEAGRSLRPDNMHLEDAALARIVADVVVPAITAATDNANAEDTS